MRRTHRITASNEPSVPALLQRVVRSSSLLGQRRRGGNVPHDEGVSGHPVCVHGGDHVYHRLCVIQL